MSENPASAVRKHSGDATLSLLFPQVFDHKGNFATQQGLSLSGNHNIENFSIGLGVSAGVAEVLNPNAKKYIGAEPLVDLDLNLSCRFSNYLSLLLGGGVVRGYYGTLDNIVVGPKAVAGIKSGYGTEIGRGHIIAVDGMAKYLGIFTDHPASGVLSAGFTYGYNIPGSTVFFVSGITASGMYGERTEKTGPFSGELSAYLGLTSIWEY